MHPPFPYLLPAGSLLVSCLPPEIIQQTVVYVKLFIIRHHPKPLLRQQEVRPRSKVLHPQNHLLQVR